MASILVTKDAHMNMKSDTCLLESNEIEVTEAVDGLKAFDMIKNSLFYLTLLDIKLPEMRGLESLKHIEENPAPQQMEAVVFTAQALGSDIQLFIDAGCIGYFSRPAGVFQFMDERNTFLAMGRRNP